MLTFNNITADSFATDTQNGAGRRRPRHREALSCSHCRDRKVRCDRKQPCRQCQNRGLSSACSYASSRDQYAQQNQQIRKPHTEPSSPSSSTSGDSDMRKRLERIESMLAAGANPTSPSDTTHRRASSTAANTPIQITSVTTLQARQGNPISAKTRYIGGTHWLAACNNMTVLKAMLSKSEEFASSQRSFADIKAWTKKVNEVPSLSAGVLIDSASLHSLLPSRNVCENWIQQYAQTYRHVYDIVDAETLERAMQSLWSSNHTGSDTLLCIVLLVVAIGMQVEENERLNGRKIARHVEVFCHTSPTMSKPSIGSMMVLLLLCLIKTLACSDTESLDSLSGIMGLTGQVAMTMGLHKDPATFQNISPYHAEVRRRLWGIFFRLNFEHSMRVGVPCCLREEDTSVGLPANADLQDAIFDNNGEIPVKDLTQHTEATFTIVAAKLAMIAAPYQRQICTTGGLSVDSVRQLREKFHELLATTPSYMRPGAKTSHATEEIQQAFLTITMHSISLLLSLSFVLNVQPDPAQKAHLLNIWDHSLSVVHSFQVLSQKTREIQTIAYQLLWSDACRAAFSASMVLNRLRIIESRSIMSTSPRHTLKPFQESLMNYLMFMSRFWFNSAHLGPRASKNSLLLAVVVAVTAKLFDHKESATEPELVAIGAKSVEDAVGSMKLAMRQRYSFPFQDGPPAPSNQSSIQLDRVLSNGNSSSRRGTSSPEISNTWPATTGVLEVGSVTSAPQIDPFVSSIDPMYGHPFITSDHHFGFNNGAMAWPADTYEFSHQPSIAGLSITERTVGTGPNFMDGLGSPQDWSNHASWDDMSMHY